jgi:hypothetical protein
MQAPNTNIVGPSRDTPHGTIQNRSFGKQSHFHDYSNYDSDYSQTDSRANGIENVTDESRFRPGPHAAMDSNNIGSAHGRPPSHGVLGVAGLGGLGSRLPKHPSSTQRLKCY